MINAINGSMPYSQVVQAAKSGHTENISANELRTLKKEGVVECKTCASRKYQDGSDENVSFKSAAHVSPQASGSAVRAHEGEHVSNAYTKAAQKNGQVINASVSIRTATCPECGRVYTAGGTTNTTIKYKNENNPYTKNQKSLDYAGLVGSKVDLKL